MRYDAEFIININAKDGSSEGSAWSQMPCQPSQGLCIGDSSLVWISLVHLIQNGPNKSNPGGEYRAVYTCECSEYNSSDSLQKAQAKIEKATQGLLCWDWEENK